MVKNFVNVLIMRLYYVAAGDKQLTCLTSCTTANCFEITLFHRIIPSIISAVLIQ